MLNAGPVYVFMGTDGVGVGVGGLGVGVEVGELVVVPPEPPHAASKRTSTREHKPREKRRVTDFM